MDLDRARHNTLTRSIALVNDFHTCCVAGVTDRNWFSRIRLIFSDVHNVPPPDFPTPLDALELPYCGMIILHLDDAATAVLEGAQTIQRCKPVLLVECKRDGHHGDAGPILARLGARELYRAGPDRIYGWAST